MIKLIERLKQQTALISGFAIEGNQISLDYRKIFIFPTRRGFYFLLLTLLLLLIGFVYNNNLIYLLSFLLASIFFVSIFHSFRSIAALQLHLGQDTNVFAGEMATIDLIVRDTAGQERPGIEVSLDHKTFSDLPQSEASHLKLLTKTTRRGLIPLGRIRIASAYPFGLVRAWSNLRFDRKLLVYPKPSTTAPSPADGHSSGDEQNSSKIRGSDDFYGQREYQKGDSLKHVNWKAYAKGQGLFSKQYTTSQSRELWFDYQNLLSLPEEERLSVLCRWIIDAHRNQQTYGLCLPGLKITPNQGEDHYKKCLEALALF
jgi:uncharacterized protein (DUF58 family)